MASSIASRGLQLQIPQRDERHSELRRTATVNCSEKTRQRGERHSKARSTATQNSLKEGKHGSARHSNARQTRRVHNTKTFPSGTREQDKRGVPKNHERDTKRSDGQDKRGGMVTSKRSAAEIKLSARHCECIKALKTGVRWVVYLQPVLTTNILPKLRMLSTRRYLHHVITGLGENR